MQYTATRYNTPQHTATHLKKWHECTRCKMAMVESRGVIVSVLQSRCCGVLQCRCCGVLQAMVESRRVIARHHVHQPLDKVCVAVCCSMLHCVAVW